MPGTTPNLALPYPLGSDPVDTAADIQRLAAAVDTAVSTVAPGLDTPTADARYVNLVGDTMTGKLAFTNPVDATFLTIGWDVEHGLYELRHDSTSTLSIGPYSNGELIFSPTEATWWSSRPMTINGYNDIVISSDNTHVEVHADDHILLSRHFATNFLRLEGEDVLVGSDPVVPLGVATKQYVDGWIAALDARIAALEP